MDKNRAVTFIIPFGSRLFAKDWKSACFYLKQTILSILNNDNPNLAVVIVGNDFPEGSIPNDFRVHFTSIAAQTVNSDQVRNTAVMVRDQMTKMQEGWEYAKTHLPSKYVMRMDADDLLSRKVVGFLATENKPGFRVSDGWIWNSGDRWLIERTERFDLLCGSSNIFRSDVADKTFDIGQLLESVPEHILAAIPDLKCTLITNRFHAYAGKAMELCGLQIDRLPFGAAVYRVGNVNSEMQRTVQSHSVRFLLGRIRRLRFLSPTIRKEFALY
jgi:hypothetical protein